MSYAEIFYFYSFEYRVYGICCTVAAKFATVRVHNSLGTIEAQGTHIAWDTMAGYIATGTIRKDTVFRGAHSDFIKEAL